MNKVWCFLICILLSKPGFSETKYTIYTEEFPPYNFTKNSKIHGASTQVIEALFKEAGLKYQIVSRPWARSYRSVQEEKSSFIYSISRRENREKLFKWVGKIAPSNHCIFARKGSNFKISKLEDLSKFEIGTTIDDARESYLVSKGIPLDKLQRTSGKDSAMQNYKKLMAKRIDLWPMPKAVATYLLKRENIEISSTLEVAFELEDMAGWYYLAANLDTPDEIISKLQESLEVLKKKNLVSKLTSKWSL